MSAKTQKSAVGLDIKPEDEAYALRRNQWDCAIVRCIQRTLPDATRVKANKKTISFTLDRDDTRYTFLTPPEVIEGVIKPFDEERPITLHNFVLADPVAAEPVRHRSVQERQRQRMRRRTRRVQTGTSSASVRTYERFLEGDQ